MEWKPPICAEIRKGRNFSNLRRKKWDVKRLGFTVGFEQRCQGQFLSQSNHFCPGLGETQIGKKCEATASGAGIHQKKKPVYGNGHLFPCTQTQLYLWRGKRDTKAAVAPLFASVLVIWINVHLQGQLLYFHHFQGLLQPWKEETSSHHACGFRGDHGVAKLTSGLEVLCWVTTLG